MAATTGNAAQASIGAGDARPGQRLVDMAERLPFGALAGLFAGPRVPAREHGLGGARRQAGRRAADRHLDDLPGLRRAEADIREHRRRARHPPHALDRLRIGFAFSCRCCESPRRSWPAASCTACRLRPGARSRVDLREGAARRARARRRPRAGVLVGAWAVAPLAGEWIHQAMLAVKAEVPLAVLADTAAQFPTFSEAYRKGVEGLEL